jgi:transglutaminase-like putative cysteine protease
VLRGRRGVCQDFAQLMIGCLRGIGLPARYVSGYLLKHPPAGKQALDVQVTVTPLPLLNEELRPG